MDGLSSDGALRLFLALGVLLAGTRLLGEVARRLAQPAVLGEIAAGVLLGPTVLGRAWPEAVEYLFPREGPVASALEGLLALAVALFLLAAGMEVDLSGALRRGRTMLAVALGGIALPFGLGWLVAWRMPEWFGLEPGRREALFFATALSISALPVIARTLMDLRLHRSELGVVVIGAAVINDLVGWLCFAVVIGSAPLWGGGPAATSIATLVVALGALTVGRWAVHRALGVVLRHTSWPGGVLAFALALALFGAAATTWLGLHAVFGAFLAGVALGDSSHLRGVTRTTIGDFVGHFFAPLFFGSIGLAVDYAASFDPLLCAAVLVVACAGKVLGCGLGARWSGVPPREAWAIGFALNARGSMEVVLGLLALRAGLIGEPLFVALVVMALATSLMSAPLLQRLVGRPRPRGLLEHAVFVPELRARDRRAAIAELAAAVGGGDGVAVERLVELAWERERAGPTGVGDAVALPHARVPGLRRPRVALGVSRAGIDFDAHDGLPATIVALVLTPADDPGAQLEVLAALGGALGDPQARARLVHARGPDEMRALLEGGP